MGWSHSLLNLIEVRYDPLTQLSILELASFSLVVVEIGGELSPPTVKFCAIFQFGGRGSGNNFVGSGAMPL